MGVLVFLVLFCLSLNAGASAPCEQALMRVLNEGHIDADRIVHQESCGQKRHVCFFSGRKGNRPVAVIVAEDKESEDAFLGLTGVWKDRVNITGSSTTISLKRVKRKEKITFSKVEKSLRHEVQGAKDTVYLCEQKPTGIAKKEIARPVEAEEVPEGPEPHQGASGILRQDNYRESGISE
jgi:hypothetical protein